MKRTFQPATASAVDWMNPLSAGLEVLFVARPLGGVELVSRRTAIQSAGATPSPVWWTKTIYGDAVDGSASGNSHIMLDTPPALEAAVVLPGVTIFAVTQNDRFGQDPVASGFAFGIASSDANATLAGLGTGGTGLTRRLRFSWRDAGNVTRVIVDSSSDVWAAGDTGLKVVAASWGGAGDLTLACNGQILSQSVTISPQAITAVAPTSVVLGAMCRSGPQSSARLLCYAGGFYRRALSAGELIELTNQPYQLVAPARNKNYQAFAAAIAGSSLPTLSALTPASITSTSAIPRVSATWA